jgi:hypothetical protein
MARIEKIGSLAPGINNRREPTRLSTRLANGQEGSYLTAADNVDLNQDGYIKRRDGTTSAIEGAAHSLWSDGGEGYGVIAGNLERLTDGGDQLQRDVVRAAMPNLPLSYSRGADGHVYWSNGQALRRIVNGVDRPVLTEPVPAPAISRIAGAMPAGRYLVAFTRNGPDGESPASTAQAIDLPANSGIAFTSSLGLDVYLSAPNGDVLTLQMQGASGTCHIVTRHEGGRRCATLNRALMPAGSIVRHYNGALLVAAGPTLFVSDPYYYGLYDPSRSYIPFPAPITVVESTARGVYVCADRTYWLSPTDPTSGMTDVLPYGGIAGTGGQSAVDKTVFWQSPRGLVVADDQGQAKAVQEGAIKFGAARSGATLYRESDGSNHIVSTRFGVESSVAAATSFMDAEIVRKGTKL